MSNIPAPAREPDSAGDERIQAVRSLKPGAHVHISGICGTGTASVLSLLKQLGYRVSGSDKAFYPPMGEVVRQLADKVYEGYSAANLQETPDLVVIGNALSADNPEVREVFARKLPYASMPEVFQALLIGNRDECRTSVVVAGTHGKTTTSAAIASLLDAAGRRPGYFIGGVPDNLPSSIRPPSKELLPNNRVVVLEGDEYDSAFFAKYPKFHSYRPDIAVITSLEFDHADIYHSIEEIEEEFTRLARRVPADGVLLVCDNCERLTCLCRLWEEDPEVQAKVLRYGTSSDSRYRLLGREPWRYQDIPEKRVGQRLSFELAGSPLTALTQLTGEHNALNLLVAAAVCRRLGVGNEEISAGIRRFTGVRRRQQVLYEADGLVVIEDFAHHPSAVLLTLNGLRESYPKKRIFAAYEARSNTSRRNYFQDDYPKSFGGADVVLLLKVHNAGGYSGTDKEVTALDIEKIVAEISNGGRQAEAFDSVDDIQSYLLREVRSGDLVVLMSNGDFGGLPRNLVEALEKR